MTMATPSRTAPAGKLSTAAMKKISAVCAGNGFRKSDVELVSSTDGFIEIAAVSRIEPSVAVNTREEKGRKDGDKVFEDKEALEEELNELKSTLARNEELLNKIRKHILSRKDKGIGTAPQQINLKTLNTSYVAHVACSTCRKTGTQTCPDCRGAKTKECIRCHGSKTVRCIVCGGTTTIRSASGSTSICPRCQGRGQLACDFCSGRGQIQCTKCSGEGKISCLSCGGEGENSLIARVTMQVRVESKLYLLDVSKSELPNQLAKEILTIGPRLITGKVGRITESRGGKDKEGMPLLQHKISIPATCLQIKLGRRELTVHAIGYNIHFLDLPPVIEQALTPVFAGIEKTAAQHDPVATLQRIGKYTIFREAMALTSDGSVNHAALQLGRKYVPFISQDRLHSLALTTNRLLDRTTRRPRFLADLLIALLMGGFFYFCLCGPGAPLLDKGHHLLSTYTANAERLSELLVLFAALVITSPLYEFLAALLFRRHAGALLPPRLARLLLSKMRRFKALPYVITLLAFVLIYALRYITS